MEKEHPFSLRFGDDPCSGVAQPNCTVASRCNQVITNLLNIALVCPQCRFGTLILPFFFSPPVTLYRAYDQNLLWHLFLDQKVGKMSNYFIFPDKRKHVVLFLILGWITMWLVSFEEVLWCVQFFNLTVFGCSWLIQRLIQRGTCLQGAQPSWRSWCT